MKFQNYFKPNNEEEALALISKPDTVILGGMMWLHLQNRTVTNAVDLSGLGLDKIEIVGDGIQIGAMVTLRELEINPLLNDYTNGEIANNLSPIAGVQFRNLATIGGSIFGRFGFSNVAVLFTALGANVRLSRKRIVSMKEFIETGASGDILTHIILPLTKPDKIVSYAHRHSATDFPALELTLCKRNETIRMTISPAPTRGYTEDFTTNELQSILDKLMQSLKFGSNAQAGAEYRRHIARVYLERGLKEIGGTQ